MLKIGEFSKLSKISIRMLRHYDEIGLLIPTKIDTFTNYRYYNEEQLRIASRISNLKEMGFSLSSIEKILKIYDDPKAFSEFLTIQKLEAKSQLEESKRRLMLIENTINQLRKDETTMNYSVILKEMPEIYVASVRKKIPSYDQEGILWNILMQETKHLNLHPDTPCYTLAIFHDGEYKESDVDVEVQKSVKGTYKDTHNVVFKTVKPFEFASSIYKGNYDKITEANQAVAKWVYDNGYEFNGLSFSIYHVSPHETSNRDEYVTEVCYPVKKK